MSDSIGKFIVGDIVWSLTMRAYFMIESLERSDDTEVAYLRYVANSDADIIKGSADFHMPSPTTALLTRFDRYRRRVEELNREEQKLKDTLEPTWGREL